MTQCGMNLRQRKVRVLKMDLLWTPPMRDLVLRDFNDFRSSVVYPRNSAVVDSNMSAGDKWHTSMNAVYPFKASASKAEILKGFVRHPVDKETALLTSPEVSG